MDLEKWGHDNSVFCAEYLPNSSFAKIANNMDSSGKCKKGFKKCSDDSSISSGVCLPDTLK